jgi:hypothetical protein
MRYIHQYDGGYNASSSAIIDFVNLGLAPSVDTLIVSLSRFIAATNEPRVNEAVKQALPEHALFNNVGDASNGNVVFPGKYIKSRYTNCMMVDITHQALP